MRPFPLSNWAHQKDLPPTVEMRPYAESAWCVQRPRASYVSMPWLVRIAECTNRHPPGSSRVAYRSVDCRPSCHASNNPPILPMLPVSSSDHVKRNRLRRRFLAESTRRSHSRDGRGGASAPCGPHDSASHGRRHRCAADRMGSPSACSLTRAASSTSQGLPFTEGAMDAMSPRRNGVCKKVMVKVRESGDRAW